MVANKNFRLAKLEAKYFSTYQALTSTPQTLVALAAALSLTTVEATRRLSFLVNEGLAVARKRTGKTLPRTYQLAT
jgi:hypothetical protein